MSWDLSSSAARTGSMLGSLLGFLIALPGAHDAGNGVSVRLPPGWSTPRAAGGLRLLREGRLLRFSDEGRQFQAMVAVGKPEAPWARREAPAVLDEMRIGARRSG